MFVIIHSQTEWNAAGRFQGHEDSPLTQDGVGQAKLVGSLIKSHYDVSGFKIVSSPLGRAVATSELIADVLGLPRDGIKTDARLMEVALGCWEGLTREDIERGWPGYLAGTDCYNWYFKAPDGERYEQVVERVGDWLSSIGDHGALVAVTHGVTGRILRGLYAGYPRDRLLSLEVARDSVFVLQNGAISKIGSMQ